MPPVILPPPAAQVLVQVSSRFPVAADMGVDRLVARAFQPFSRQAPADLLGAVELREPRLDLVLEISLHDAFAAALCFALARLAVGLERAVAPEARITPDLTRDRRLDDAELVSDVGGGKPLLAQGVDDVTVFVAEEAVFGRHWSIRVERCSTPKPHLCRPFTCTCSLNPS